MELINNNSSHKFRSDSCSSNKPLSLAQRKIIREKIFIILFFKSEWKTKRTNKNSLKANQLTNYTYNKWKHEVKANRK